MLELLLARAFYYFCNTSVTSLASKFCSAAYCGLLAARGDLFKNKKTRDQIPPVVSCRRPLPMLEAQAVQVSGANSDGGQHGSTAEELNTSSAYSGGTDGANLHLAAQSSIKWV